MSSIAARVQMSRADEIRREWIWNGQPRCTHKKRDKEYYLGADTGDWLCMTCGISWMRGTETPPPAPREDE